jgi:2-dehydropantoate 2-reductase
MTGSEPVYIIGAGAIGSALAVRLSGAGRQVIVVRASRGDVAWSRTELVVRGADHGEVRAQLATVSLELLDTLRGILVVATKSYGNAQLAAKLRQKDGVSPIVIMQNGLGVEEPFLAAGFREVYRCVVFATSEQQADGSYSFRAIKPCPIGVVSGHRERLHEIVQTLSTPGFLFVEDDLIQRTIWQKAIINAVFNSICPLLDVDNGIFHRSDSAKELAERIVDECLAVAEGERVELDRGQILEQLLAISEASTGQAISTLQDIRRGNPTEIASLNLEIAKIGDRATPPVRAEQTKLLGRLIELKAAVRRGH